jgi:hypothetical protein
MAVAVSLGATGFDFTPLIREQQRLSKQLVEPKAAGRTDPTQPLVYNPTGLPNATTYNCYIKVLEPNSNQPGAQPTYQLFYRDNNNAETQLASLPAGAKLGDSTTTGNVFFDLDSGEIRIGAPANYSVGGTIQFQAASGLTLAAVNRRLADINSAIEAMSRVMQVANGATEGVQQLLR